MDTTHCSPREGGDIEDRMSAVEQACLSTANDIRDIKRILLGQSGEIRGIKETLSDHEKRFDRIDQRFERVDERFGEMDRRFEQVIEQVDQRFEQVDRQFETLTAEVGVMRGELQSVASRQERHGSEIARILRRLELAPTKL